MDSNTFDDFKESVEDHGLEGVGLFYGMYRGLCMDNKDPDAMGRIKITVPGIYNDTLDYWTPSMGQYAGSGAGMFIIPKIGDQVWVMFEQGNPRWPIWQHGWYSKGDAPEAANNNSNNPTNQVWQSYTGHRIELDDGKNVVRITHKDGTYIELNENGASIVSDKISLGTLDGSKEPAVLGDTAMDLLNEMLDDIGKLGAITTSTGVTGLINTSPQWSALAAKWKDKFKNFKSDKVTLD